LCKIGARDCERQQNDDMGGQSCSFGDIWVGDELPIRFLCPQGALVKVLLLALFAAASVATAVVAAEGTTPSSTTPAAVPAPVAPPSSKKDPNARVCKTSPVIGTRVPSRICMTRAEWEARTRQDRQDLEASQRGGLTTCATNPCGG
jgi:hypothetical protein